MNEKATFFVKEPKIIYNRNMVEEKSGKYQYKKKKFIPGQINQILSWLIDALPYTIVTDGEGYVVKLTKAYAEYLGIDADDAVGRYITDVVPTSGIPDVIKTGKGNEGQVFVLKNGEEIVVSRYPIYNNGQLAGVISTTILGTIDKIDELNAAVANLIRENEGYRRQIKRLKNSTDSMNKLIGETPAIKDLKDNIARVAPFDTSVLIVGENGTGKEICANAIHQLSPRAKEPYVKINCGAISAGMLESELFGYERGAFSGANKNGKPGKLELANHGTILLDGISEMPLSVQSKILRVIQEQEIERIGAIKPTRVDVRILCSTTKDLEKMVKEGTFNRDLYYLINILEVKTPSLKERKDDLPKLCDYIIRNINATYNTSIDGISQDVITIFENYDWPGNIRELEYALERAAISVGSGILNPEYFDSVIRKSNGDESVNTEIDHNYMLQTHRTQFEKNEIQKALMLAGGNKAKAARMLNISRSTLYEKIKAYNI